MLVVQQVDEQLADQVSEAWGAGVIEDLVPTSAWLWMLTGYRLFAACGAVAQLGERRVRNAKVGSSILLGSTNLIWCADSGAISGSGLA